MSGSTDGVDGAVGASKVKRLYEVTVTYYVMAEDEAEAVGIQTLGGDPTIEVALATSVGAEWWHAIPFGGDDDRTCGEILEGQNRQPALPPCHGYILGVESGERRNESGERRNDEHERS